MLALVTIILHAYKLRLLLTAGINHITRQAGDTTYLWTSNLPNPSEPLNSPLPMLLLRFILEDQSGYWSPQTVITSTSNHGYTSIHIQSYTCFIPSLFMRQNSPSVSFSLQLYARHHILSHLFQVHAYLVISSLLSFQAFCCKLLFCEQVRVSTFMETFL